MTKKVGTGYNIYIYRKVSGKKGFKISTTGGGGRLLFAVGIQPQLASVLEV